MNVSARNELLLKNMPLVGLVIRNYLRMLPRFVERKDLEQQGVFGLADAIERFDETRGTAFSTFACARIRGSILDYLRELCWAPRLIRDRARATGEELALIVSMEPKHYRISEKYTYNAIDEADGLEHWLKCLPEQSRQVVRLRVLDDCTFREIGERLSPEVTESRAHQIYREAESIILSAGAKADRKFVSNQV